MSDDERITQLEERLARAEARIAALEYRPFPSETHPGAIVTIRPTVVNGDYPIQSPNVS